MNNLAILECGLQLPSGWDEDVTLKEAHDKHLWLTGLRRALLFLCWSPLCMWMTVDIGSPGLCSCPFFFFPHRFLSVW